MRIVAISLKYNRPDMFSHLVSFGEQAAKNGHAVSYLFAEHCRWLVEEYPSPLDAAYLGASHNGVTVLRDTLLFHTIHKQRIRDLMMRLQPEALFFGNMHPANVLVARLAREAGCREIWWWLHEPYTREKRLHGWWRRHYIVAVEALQNRFLRMVDRVVLSSDEAMSQFRSQLGWYQGKVIQVPLIFLDYYEAISPPPYRYITFVGSAVPAKGIDTFWALIEHAARQNAPYEFQIVTGSDIRQPLARLSEAARQRLRIVTGDRLSDLQLGRAVRDSLCVITPYRRVTQSGVVPVAFMHGVPVISSNIGAMPESVRHGETGLLLPPNAPLDGWLAAAGIVRHDRDRLGWNCRHFYEERFSPVNWQKVFPVLFEGF